MRGLVNHPQRSRRDARWERDARQLRREPKLLKQPRIDKVKPQRDAATAAAEVTSAPQAAAASRGCLTFTVQNHTRPEIATSRPF